MKKMSFVKSATLWRDFPEKRLPEIAIAGRSNCGKSSFINSLAQRAIAKVSQKPGKTRLLNIFAMGTLSYLVDMPGYGYAARSMVERRAWQQMIEGYFNQSEDLAGLILLMDIRRDWAEDEELLLQFCLAHDLPMALGLTKSDKMSRSQWKNRLLKVEKQLEGIPVFAISSKKKWGVEEIVGHTIKNWLSPIKDNFSDSSSEE